MEAAKYAGKPKQTRRQAYLAEIDLGVSMELLLNLLEPISKAGRRLHSYPLETMLRLHLTPGRFGLNNRQIREALYEITTMRIRPAVAAGRDRAPMLKDVQVCLIW